MRVCVIGAGALGGSYGGRLALSGVDVTLIDIWAEHIAAINRDGLRLDGVPGDHLVKLVASTSADGLAPFDLAIITVDSNHTSEAAQIARDALRSDGFALTLQNGIGNVEALTETLGAEHVVGGSSMCSAALQAAGHVSQTHQGPTTIGELTVRAIFAGVGVGKYTGGGWLRYRGQQRRDVGDLAEVCAQSGDQSNLCRYGVAAW